MGSAFRQLCPSYSGTLTPTAPTAIKLWDTFTFTKNELEIAVVNEPSVFEPLKGYCNFLWLRPPLNNIRLQFNIKKKKNKNWR